MDGGDCGGGDFGGFDFGGFGLGDVGHCSTDTGQESNDAGRDAVDLAPALFDHLSDDEPNLHKSVSGGPPPIPTSAKPMKSSDNRTVSSWSAREYFDVLAPLVLLIIGALLVAALLHF